MKGLLTEWCPFNVDSGLVTEAIKQNDGKLIVSGVMQRANAKNQNGRIYKKALLEREIDKYSKNEVAQRRALGELDHSDCFHETTEIMCETGWKLFKDVAEDEKVYTLNLNTKKIELQQITKKIHQHYNNKMVSLKGKNINTLVTPNHRFLLVDRYGNESFVTAIEIYNNRTAYDKCYIPKHGFNGTDVDDSEYVTIPRVDSSLFSYNDKYIPTHYKRDGVNNLNELYEGFMLGDGTRFFDRHYQVENVSTTSPRLADDLQEVMLKIGIGSNRVIQKNDKPTTISGRKIIGKYPVHRVKKAKSKGIYLDSRYLQMELVDYDGYISCVSVPNETIYVRDNGKPFWSGNSSTVNLKNVSHNILECWWDGDDLYGKIEVLNTPAGNILKELFKAGITVGISSRGMGSVKPISEGDAMEVQNDFELVTFDFVSNPSTHGAFMSPVKESVERTNYNGNAHKLAHDILCEMTGVCCIKGV